MAMTFVQIPSPVTEPNVWTNSVAIGGKKTIKAHTSMLRHVITTSAT
jgi:hypothetical protein